LLKGQRIKKSYPLRHSKNQSSETIRHRLPRLILKEERKKGRKALEM